MAFSSAVNQSAATEKSNARYVILLCSGSPSQATVSPYEEPGPRRNKAKEVRHAIAGENISRTLVEFSEGAGCVGRNALWPDRHDQDRYPHENYRNG